MTITKWKIKPCLLFRGGCVNTVHTVTAQWCKQGWRFPKCLNISQEKAPSLELSQWSDCIFRKKRKAIFKTPTWKWRRRMQPWRFSLRRPCSEAARALRAAHAQLFGKRPTPVYLLSSVSKTQWRVQHKGSQICFFGNLWVLRSNQTLYSSFWRFAFGVT